MDIGFENQIERNKKKGQDNRKKRRGKTAYLNNDWAMSISETGSGNERKANIQFSGPWNVAQLQPFRNQKVKSINRPPGIAGNRRESPRIDAEGLRHPSAIRRPLQFQSNHRWIDVRIRLNLMAKFISCCQLKESGIRKNPAGIANWNANFNAKWLDETILSYFCIFAFLHFASGCDGCASDVK